MIRFLCIVGICIGLSFFVIAPAIAVSNDAYELQQKARDIRQRIADLDNQLHSFLQKMLTEFGNRKIACNGQEDIKTLSECVKSKDQDLTQTKITIAHGTTSKTEPIKDLADTEERFELFNTRMNDTNDLLAQAGADIFRQSLDVIPEMDQFRRDVIEYAEHKKERDLRVKQAGLILAMLVTLLIIFSLIYWTLRRLKGN